MQTVSLHTFVQVAQAMFNHMQHMLMLCQETNVVLLFAVFYTAKSSTTQIKLR